MPCGKMGKYGQDPEEDKNLIYQQPQSQGANPHRSPHYPHLGIKSQRLCPGPYVANEHRAGYGGKEEYHLRSVMASGKIDQQPKKQYRFRVAVDGGIEKGTEDCASPGDPCQRPIKEIKGSSNKHEEAANKEVPGGQYPSRANIQHKAEDGYHIGGNPRFGYHPSHGLSNVVQSLANLVSLSHRDLSSKLA